MNEDKEVQKDWASVAEQTLWQAVISSTIEDWLHGPLRQRREAELYLFEDRKDFPSVCRSAGMDAEYLRARLAKMREKNPQLECLRPLAA